MNWIQVSESLPQNGQAVIIKYAGDNWKREHTLADGTKREYWRWQAMMFSNDNPACVQYQQPYCWLEFGPLILMSHEVSHWCAIEDVESTNHETLSGSVVFNTNEPDEQPKGEPE